MSPNRYRHRPAQLVRTSYDALGNLTLVNYNAFGELVEQTDARDIRICQTYDKLGRMTLRIDGCHYYVGHYDRLVTTWTYDSAAGKGVGQLHKATGPYVTNGAGVQQTNPYEETYTYDSLGRPSQVKRLIDGVYFWSDVGFDDQGRVASQTFPASDETATATLPGGRRHKVNYEYNDRGALSVVKSEAGTAYWTLGSTDALGNVTGFELANSVLETRTYDPATGYLVNQLSYGGGSLLLSADYEWSLRGNLTQRRDNAMISPNPLTEILEYDPYDRLTTVKVTAPSINGGSQQTYTNSYSSSGRLLTKGTSNGGSYTNYSYGTGNSYGAGDAGPHAVTSVVANGTSRVYTYDNNGNTLTGAGRSFVWTAANLPSQISTNNTAEASVFHYGPDRARYSQYTQSPCTGCNCVQPTSKTLYVGDSFERITTNQNSTVQYRHSIRAGSLTIAIHNEYSTGSGTTDHYLHHDHLGSVVAMTNSSGVVVERFSFDPWGKRRNAGSSTAWSALAPGSDLFPTTLNIQRRGFTNHEHLDKLGLIHMNGRVYDPELGRFVSADPLIQFPESTQGLDRYAYVNNNPLSYTDPSGHLVWFVAAAMIGAKLGAEYWVASVLIAGAAGYLETGTLRGALFSALSAGVAHQVGVFFDGLANVGQFAAELGRALAHGFTQGALAAAQGGGFGAGFLSAAFASGWGSSGIGRGIKNGTVRVMAAAVVGGTASRIGGGKFANGAATAAFVQAFSGASSDQSEDPARLDSQSGSDAPADVARANLDAAVLAFDRMYTDGALAGEGWEFIDKHPYDGLSDRAMSLHYEDRIGTTTAFGPTQRAYAEQSLNYRGATVFRGGANTFEGALNTVAHERWHLEPINRNLWTRGGPSGRVRAEAIAAQKAHSVVDRWRQLNK